MVFAKKASKSVMVETKKLSGTDSCCTGSSCFGHMKHVFIVLLLIVNVFLLLRVLCNQVSLEADKVGGRANYKMVQQIYKSQAFKDQQTQQIQQALQMYQGGAEGTEQLPVVTPTVTQ